MATTIIHLNCRPGTSTVYATSAGGSGTPAASYTPTQIAGYLHSIEVPEALEGDWYFGAGDVNGSRGYRTVYGLTDTATAFELTADIANSVAAEVLPQPGPRAVTATVLDDDTGQAIEDASVRLYREGDDGNKKTNASGVAQFAVQAATFTVAISAAGYEGEVATLVVDGDKTPTYRLTPITLPTSNEPEKCACTGFVVDQNGNQVTGAKYSSAVTENPTFSGNNLVHASGETAESNNGQATLNLIRGVTYRIRVKYGSTQIEFEFTVPSAASATLKPVTV